MQGHPSSRRRIAAFGTGALILLFLLLMALRAEVLFEITSSFADCPVCLGATAAQQDAGLLALLIACIGMTLLTRRYWLQLPFLLLSIALILVYAVDIATTKTLTQRLFLFDAVKFGKELGAIVQFSDILLATVGGKIALAVATGGIVILSLALLPRPYKPRLAIPCFIAAAALALFGSWRPVTMNYIHYELLQNVVVANLAFGADTPYSKPFTEKIERDYVPFSRECEPGQSLHPNIIVLEVESLSTHVSQLFGGFRDLMPRLDAIARSNAYIPDFIANGFTTDGGLIAIVTGKAPIPMVGRYQSTQAFAGYTDSHGALPEIVHAAGYTAHFFTTGELGFLDEGKWLDGLGFDSYEGAEQPYYSNWKHRHFGAAEDKALYLRLLHWLDQRPADSHWFALLSTLSTHPPFVDPASETPGEEGAFRYADVQIGTFYEELQKRGFFQNGVLLITGDHRSMTPLFAQEHARFGDSALARTPLVLATDLPIARGAIDGRFAQTDIPSSIADLIDAQSCRTAAQGAFLRPHPQPAQYVLHVRGDRRNEVNVYFGDQRATILLDGDATRWEGPRPQNWQQIMNDVLIGRIRHGAVDENLIDEMVKLRSPSKPDSKQ